MSLPIVGVDVSKHKLHAAWLVAREPQKFHRKAVANTREGLAALLAWVERQTGSRQAHFILEATNVYHELAAEQLYAAGARVSVVNPAQVSYFAKSQGIHSKSDGHDRRTLALYGYERRPRAWQPMPAHAKALREMLQRAAALEADLQRERNRLETAELRGHSEVLRSHRSLIATLEREIERLHELIREHIDRYPDLRERRALLESVPGIGSKLAAELNALFSSRVFTSAREVAAYLGLAPRARQSGTSLRAPGRMTKAGDARLRALLYFPAVSAIRHNPTVRALYLRLRGRGKNAKAAIGAAMRKLVHIAFGVLKHRRTFRPEMA